MAAAGYAEPGSTSICIGAHKSISRSRAGPTGKTRPLSGTTSSRSRSHGHQEPSNSPAQPRQWGMASRGPGQGRHAPCCSGCPVNQERPRGRRKAVTRTVSGRAGAGPYRQISATLSSGIFSWMTVSVRYDAGFRVPQRPEARGQQCRISERRPGESGLPFPAMAQGRSRAHPYSLEAGGDSRRVRK